MELLTHLLITYSCYKFAKEKNRNETFWVIFGLMFPTIALLTLVLLPKKEVI